MASVATLGCIPPVIEAGTTVRFTLRGRYPSSLWTLQLVLNNGSDAPTVLTGEANDDGSFSTTLSADQSAALKEGQYVWGEVYTTVSTPHEVARGNDGGVTVLASLTATAVPSQAECMVATLTGAMQSLAASPEQSVNFNGQQFTRANIGDYQKQVTYWQAIVEREKAQKLALRGAGRSSSIQITFGHVGGPCYGFGNFGCWNR